VPYRKGRQVASSPSSGIYYFIQYEIDTTKVKLKARLCRRGWGKEKKQQQEQKVRGKLKEKEVCN